MLSLPPEIIAYIIELAIPPTTFRDFPERSSILRSLSAVSNIFRQEAQNRLFREAVYYPRREDDTRSLTLFDLLESNRSKVSVRHLRVDGSGSFLEKPSLPEGVGRCLAGSLTSLSLAHTWVDPDMFHSLLSLRHLSLHMVKFFPTSLNKQPQLPQITDLSIKQTLELPSCLTMPQLPNLRRLAQRFATTTTSGHFAFANILARKDQLDFFVCSYDEGIYRREDVSLIADFTLFDVPEYLFHRSGDATGSLHKVKHARVGFIHKMEGRTKSSSKNNMVRLKLKDFVWNVMPSLETLIVPSHWERAGIFEDFKAAMEESGRVILFENDRYRDLMESRISVTFKEYRRRMKADVGGGN